MACKVKLKSKRDLQTHKLKSQLLNYPIIQRLRES